MTLVLERGGRKGGGERRSRNKTHMTFFHEQIELKMVPKVVRTLSMSKFHAI